MIKKYRKPYRVKRLQPTLRILLRQRRRHLKSIFKNRFFWLGILILLIFGGIFYLIGFSSFFQIKEIKISDNQKVSAENLRNVIESQIIRNFLFFSTKSIFLADFPKIKVKISETFPQIAQINFKREFPDTLTVTVEERKPIAVFNQEDLYFFLDKEGIIFENTLADGQLIKIKKAVKDKELKLGDRVLEKELLSTILEIESKLENNLKVPIEEVLVVSDERINLKTSEGWEIYFNPKGDVEWQLTKLRVVLEEEIPPERRKDLEYIELRFGNFAPYKYRD
jgi:cell division septal protein FtsQ